MAYKIFWVLMLPAWVWSLWSYYKGKDQRGCTYCAYFFIIYAIIEKIFK